ncbi:sigma-54 factor interaction domain-containing protein, partial [Acidithiobacillus ferriphilus]
MVSARLLRPEKSRLTSVIGESSAWKVILNALNALSRAPSSISVLLTGETGTGKEVVARALHEQSDRTGKPFIAINCAAIPSDLLESVLFGYEKGAFTGALSRTTGKFEQADGGTILLDEIGDMPLPLQAKLLRVL